MTNHNPDNRKTPRPDKRSTQTGQPFTPAQDKRGGRKGGDNKSVTGTVGAKK